MLLDLPFVSVCTPTYNRRKHFHTIIECFKHQDYPKLLVEWVIIDDGSDKIEDLVADIPQVSYHRYENKMKLGEKRNIMHEKAKGDIIIYMDDDDYYPPERVSHAVSYLNDKPNILCAGSSKLYIYFKDIKKIYSFGPYFENHATASTFAFKKELLKITKYNSKDISGEEKYFLKNYTIPLIQLNPFKTTLLISHDSNTVDKKDIIKYGKLSKKNINVFIKNQHIIDLIDN
jgi:glycosyltransferase involved in cell wall biosynthesis